MAETRVSTFRGRAEERGIETTRVSAASLTDAIRDAVEPPAVGAPLESVESSLPTSVQTDPSTVDLEAARTGVTPAAYGVASEGATALFETGAMTGPISLFPERHVAVLRTDDLLADVPALFERLDAAVDAGRDDVVLLAGPSATSDMGERVTGVHGPAEMHVLLYDP